MYKKTILTLLIGITTLGAGAFAASGPIYPANGNDVQQPMLSSSNTFDNTEEVSASSITIEWGTEAEDPVFGSAYAESFSSASEMEDTIVANVKIYDSNGDFLNGDEETNYDSSYVKATATNPTWNQSGDWAEGYHEWAKSGYTTEKRSSSATW